MWHAEGERRNSEGEWIGGHRDASLGGVDTPQVPG